MNQLDFSPEVKTAILEHKPIVALESTIISHGMPYPQNLETALEVEEIVRQSGATPATIAIIDGRFRIGLDRAALESFAQDKTILKASRRDLPIVFARKQHAATTVAATMIGAFLAGIKVFTTGGIGGVHRGAERNFDISADLQELAQTEVAVVCAGAKAILDLPLTLEYLETHGVPVLGYQTEEFPAFYSRESGLKVDARVENGTEIATIMKAKWDSNLHGGVLVCNPIPAEFSLEKKKIDALIQSALNEAAARQITGKALTPFLLAKITALSGGESLKSNIGLIKSNAALGAKIAQAYAVLHPTRGTPSAKKE
jgi:pseudouridine-5'-phosphate glycosidase